MAKSSNPVFSGMFLGEFERSLDPQCRVSLPSEWRSQDEGATFVMMPTANAAAILLPEAAFRKFFEAAAADSIADVELQEHLAYLGSQSRFCRCDKQGRMALDREKLSGLGITEQLKLVGAVTHIRLCAPGKWQSDFDQEKVGHSLEAVKNAKSSASSALAGILTSALQGKK